MFHYQPLKPMDRAIFAINRTIKFINQNDKIRGVELRNFEYYMVDAMTLLFLIIVLLVITAVYILKAMWLTVSFYLNWSVSYFLGRIRGTQENDKKMQ